MENNERQPPQPSGLERLIPVVFMNNEDIEFEKKNKYKKLSAHLYVDQKHACVLEQSINNEASASELLGTVQMMVLNILRDDAKIIQENGHFFANFERVRLKTGINQEFIDKLKARLSKDKVDGPTLNPNIIEKIVIPSIIPYMVVKVYVERI